MTKNRYIFVFLCIFLIIIASVLIFKFSHRLLQRRRLPRVALVIDDWGYNLNNVDLLRTIDIPITLAVLPNLKHSKEIAKEARFRNREIILHMPMEPESSFIRLERYTITADMGGEEIASIFDRALDSVPGAKGVSNHMGSRFTADSRAMNILVL